MKTCSPRHPSETPVSGFTTDARMYTDLAPWFHLLSDPSEYAEAADLYWSVIRSASSSPPRTLLELGSGGGGNAYHLKARCRLTLVDLSPEMLALSASLNPDCEHVEGDMRSVRLGRLFDAVFVQDAVSHMLTEEDLEAAARSALVHCRLGGVALFAPDYVRESFRPSTGHGGNDGTGRGMRYLEWTWDPDPDDSTYLVDLAYLLHDERGDLRVEVDRLELGLFSRADWLRIIGSVGFEARSIVLAPGEAGPGSEAFLGVKPPA